MAQLCSTYSIFMRLREKFVSTSGKRKHTDYNNNQGKENSVVSSDNCHFMGGLGNHAGIWLLMHSRCEDTALPRTAIAVEVLFSTDYWAVLFSSMSQRLANSLTRKKVHALVTTRRNKPEREQRKRRVVCLPEHLAYAELEKDYSQ